jgi:hypothetical protein
LLLHHSQSPASPASPQSLVPNPCFVDAPSLYGAARQSRAGVTTARARHLPRYVSVCDADPIDRAFRLCRILPHPLSHFQFPPNSPPTNRSAKPVRRWSGAAVPGISSHRGTPASCAAPGGRRSRVTDEFSNRCATGPLRTRRTRANDRRAPLLRAGRCGGGRVVSVGEPMVRRGGALTIQRRAPWAQNPGTTRVGGGDRPPAQPPQSVLHNPSMRVRHLANPPRRRGGGAGVGRTACEGDIQVTVVSYAPVKRSS